MEVNALPRRTPQSVYAESLRHCMDRYGYPLLSPKPSSTLGESYQKEGLKIGDVGYVDPNGIFYVCCNIRCPPDVKVNSRIAGNFQNIELNETSDIEINPGAIPSPMVIKSSCTTEDHCDNLSAPRVFRPKSSPGAILILPSGARFENLRDSTIKTFRGVAEKHGHKWCMMTQPAPALLITGLYKARSWSLGCFDSPLERITVAPRDDRLPPEKYMWNADNGTIFASEHSEACGLNQTIFLRGFRITKKDDSMKRDRSCLSILWAYIDCLRRSKPGAVEVRHEPNFTHPFDFSNEINRRLLEKIPAAKIAIIHDNDWTHMLGEEPCEVSVQVDRIVENLLQNPGAVSMNGRGVVSLRNKISDPSPAKPISPLIVTVIKTLRVGNALSSLKRMPFGFYIQMNDLEWRTTTKFALVNNSVIEWIEELPLPDSSEKIRLSLCVTFGSDLMLSGREVLRTVEIDVRDLVETTHHMVEFCSGEPRSSTSRLFLTLGERSVDYLKAHSIRDFRQPCEDQFLTMANRTKLGHDALARYYQDYKGEDIAEAIEHFKGALNGLVREDHRYAVAVLNLATAQLNSYLLDGVCSNIYLSIISPCREVLQLLPANHLDRPAISLCLAQALLCRYGRQGYEELPDLKIEELMDGIKQSCPIDSHARQATNLILQTYKRYRLARSSNFENLDKLLEELDVAVRVCPEGYFDKPHRLINLGIALRIRSQHRENHSDLGYIDASIMVHEEAIRLIPLRHPDKTTFLISLATALLTRSGQFGDSRDLNDLNKSIEIIAEAEPLVPEGHVERAACLYTLSVALLRRFEQITDTTDPTDLNHSIQLCDEASQLIPNVHPEKATYLHSLSVALLKRFDLRSDLADLDCHISILEEILHLIPITHPDEATHLHSLSTALLKRFDLCSSLTDLDRHVSVLEEILQLIPSLHSDRVTYLHSLSIGLLRRFDLYADSTELIDVNRSISLSDEALGLVPSESPDRVPYLHSLSVALRKHFDMRSDPTDFTSLNRHIVTLEEILQIIPSNHPDRAAYLGRVSIALQTRQKQSSDPSEPRKPNELESATPETVPSSHLELTGIEDLKESDVVIAMMGSCAKFRVLVIGNSGVGKSSLIRKMFGVEEVHVSQTTRGTARIDQERISPTNEQFVVHDSLGFEAGDERNIEIVKEFVRRRQAMPRLEDQLHVIWLCVEVPYSGGRLVEVGVERFLKRQRDIIGDIPLVVVLTKMDLLDIQLGLAEPDKQISESERSKYLEEYCVKPLCKAAGRVITPVAVSVKEGYSESLAYLFKTTCGNMARDRVHEAPRAMASIGQRVNVKEKIEMSIAVGKKKYRQRLLKFRGNTFKECLEVIRKDIITVWNFNDPDQYLLDDKFIGTLLRTDNLEDPSTSQSTMASFATLLPRATFSKYDVKILMAYIVDLICVMQAIFLIASDGRVTPEVLAIALRAYEVPRKVVHMSINEFDGKQSVLPGGQNRVLDKIEELIWRHSISDQDVEQWRQRVGGRSPS